MFPGKCTLSYVTKVYPVKVYQNAKLFMSYHVLWYVHMYVLWYFQSSMLFSKKISTCLLFLLISKPRIAPAIPIPPPARPWLSYPMPKVRPAVRSHQGRQAGARGEEPTHWGPIALRMWAAGYLMVPVLKTDSSWFPSATDFKSIHWWLMFNMKMATWVPGWSESKWCGR